MPRPTPDALVYRYTASGVIAHTVVSGAATIDAFRRAGWLVLVTDRDIRFTDLDETRELDVARFTDWRDAWRLGL